ncbi:MAG: hypothetical protein AB1773_10730 [Pseudomonadota bacterium]
MSRYARTLDAVEAARRGPAAAWLAIVLLVLGFVLVWQLCEPWSAAPIAPIAALAAAGPVFQALQRIAPPGAFLPEPSYYARSARIQR